MNEKQFVAQIVDLDTGEIEYESKPTYERRAEKIADGIGINLNWEKFSVQVVAYEAKSA